jgi:predicted ArsR family transcriptional regulator
MLNGFGLTQSKILENLLQNKKGLTIDELVSILGITRTAVNQHINSLARDDYVSKHALMKTSGRPGQIYVLSNKGIHLFPKQYAWFSELLLKSLKKELGSKGLEKILSTLGEHVANTYSDRLYGRSPTEKVMEIAKIMAELGYESNTNTKGNIISACNCVFHELAAENPEVCTFDLALLSAMSGRKIEHTACMVRGNSKCRFKIAKTIKTSKTSDYQVLESIP